MALAFRIKDPDEFGILFSAYDEYTSILNSLFGRVLTPNDDYYTAPWSFMPQADNGFIIFTCNVPWYHNDTSKRCIMKKVPLENRKNYFEKALQIMKKNWRHDKERHGDIPFLDTPEDMQEILRLCDSNLITFTEDGCYPDKNDISRELEETAIIETCAAMGWQIPLEWREERKQWTKARCKHQNIQPMIFDLAAYDAAKKKAESKSHLDDEDSHKRMKYTLPPLSTTQGDGKQYDTEKNNSKQYDPANYQPQMPSLPSVSNDQSWEGGEEKKEEEEHDTPSAAVAEHLDNTCVISHLNVFYGSDDDGVVEC